MFLEVINGGGDLWGSVFCAHTMPKELLQALSVVAQFAAATSAGAPAGSMCCRAISQVRCSRSQWHIANVSVSH
jgi:hypothetical protein